MLDCNGKKMWTMPFKVDHIDEIVPGRFETGPNKGKKFFACVAGTQGFILCDFEGNILNRTELDTHRE